MSSVEIYKAIYRSQKYCEHETNSCNDVVEDLKAKLDYYEEIRPEFFNILSEIVLRSPCDFWNRDVMKATFDGLQELYDQNKNIIKVDDELLEHYYMGYSTYRQITDIIVDFENTIDDPELFTAV